MFFQNIQGLFGIHTKVCSVNGIIRLMGSLYLGPKVIPLSGAHCSKYSFINLIEEFHDQLRRSDLFYYGKSFVITLYY